MCWPLSQTGSPGTLRPGPVPGAISRSVTAGQPDQINRRRQASPTATDDQGFHLSSGLRRTGSAGLSEAPLRGGGAAGGVGRHPVRAHGDPELAQRCERDALVQHLETSLHPRSSAR